MVCELLYKGNTKGLGRGERECIWGKKHADVDKNRTAEEYIWALST